jgi:hypothetical protein
MSYSPGQSYYKQFLVNGPGNLPFNAWLMPKAVLVRNGIDDLTAKTYVSYSSLGRYSVSGIIPSNYHNNDNVNLFIYYHPKEQGDPTNLYKDILIDLGQLVKPVIFATKDS